MNTYHNISRLLLTGFISIILISVLLGVSLSVGAIETKTAPQIETDTPPIFLPLVMSNYVNLGTPIFGVQMYGNTSSSSQYHPHLIDSGANWLRVPVIWASVEPVNVAPENYNWGSVDSPLAAAREDMGNLNMIVTVDVAPDWAAPYELGPINPTNLPDFAEFVGALVERYDGDGNEDAPESPVVLHWEFYNEPDRESNWGLEGDQYKQMLQTVYPVVKAANPNAQVVFGGMAYDWFDDQGGPFIRRFLDDILTAGGGSYFDAMNIHFYPPFWVNWASQGPGLLEKIEYVRNKMNNYGVDKPIFITETGWHDNGDSNPPGDTETQNRYVVELLVHSMAGNADVMIWWPLYDAGFPYPYNMGLVTKGTTPTSKLAFYTYQTAVAEFDTTMYVRRLSNSETGASDMEVHLFEDIANRQYVYVAWLNPIDANGTKQLRLEAPMATVRSIFDGSTSVVYDADDGASDGRVTISISGRPTYVEISK